MFNRIATWYKARQKRRSITRLRAHLFSFGYNTAHLSDKEIEERLLAATAVFAQFGITATQVASAFSSSAVDKSTVTDVT